MIRQCACGDYFETSYHARYATCPAHRSHPTPIEPGLWGVWWHSRVPGETDLGDASVMPSQVDAVPHFSPVQHFGLCLISDALADLLWQGRDPRGRRRAHEAARWLLGHEPSDLSFVDALAPFALDAEKIRTRLRATYAWAFANALSPLAPASVRTVRHDGRAASDAPIIAASPPPPLCTPAPSSLGSYARLSSPPPRQSVAIAALIEDIRTDFATMDPTERWYPAYQRLLTAWDARPLAPAGLSTYALIAEGMTG